MPSLRHALPAIPVAVALLAAATAADASTVHVSDYRVEAQLAVHYQMQATPPDGTVEINAGFTNVVKLPKVTFRNGAVQTSAPGTSVLSNVETLAHFAGNGVSGDCTGHSANAIQSAPQVTEGPTYPIGATPLIVSPFGGVEWQWACTGSSVPSGLVLLNLKDGVTRAGPFDLLFDIPTEAASAGKVIQLVNRTVTGEKCPLYSSYTVACTVHSEGTVTFVRTGRHDETVPDLGSVDPADPTPATPPPVVPPTGELSGDGSTLRVRARCVIGCGKVRLNVYSGGSGVHMCCIKVMGASSASAHRRRLATRLIRHVPAGRSKRVTFHFGKAARRTIRRAGGVRVVMIATPTGGGHRARRGVVVRLPR